MNERPYRVLTIDGGGVRGLYTATVLRNLARWFASRKIKAFVGANQFIYFVQFNPRETIAQYEPRLAEATPASAPSTSSPLTSGIRSSTTWRISRSIWPTSPVAAWP